SKLLGSAVRSKLSKFLAALHDLGNFSTSKDQQFREPFHHHLMQECSSQKAAHHQRTPARTRGYIVRKLLDYRLYAACAARRRTRPPDHLLLAFRQCE